MHLCSIPNSHALFDICRTHSFPQVDDELGDLFDVDHIFALVGILLILDNFCTARHLERLLLCHTLAICGNVPKVWWCKTGVGFLGTSGQSYADGFIPAE